MIAEIYPLMRLPRRFGVFDYEIPDGADVRRGSFVRIPFRSSVVWGVVVRVKDATDETHLKPIERVSESMVLTESEAAYFEALAQDTVQSVSSILYVSIPGLPRDLI